MTGSFLSASVCASVHGKTNSRNRRERCQFSYDETVRRLLARESINTGAKCAHHTSVYLPVGKLAEEIERMDSEDADGRGTSIRSRTDMLEPFDYVAMGHIHKPMQVRPKQYVYCGTPLACSVSEAGQKKGNPYG